MTVKKHEKIGLILSGGGARAAYQVGVLKAVSELLPKDAKNPFPIICGTSAGAINTAAIAIYGANFRDAVCRLSHIWRNFRVNQVFRTDMPGIMKNSLHWLAALLVGGLGKRNPVALLDRKPLRKLLDKYLPCERIVDSIRDGVIESIGITASSYGAGKSVIFYHSSSGVQPWYRARRFGTSEPITNEHLMASSAIPIVFSAVKVGNDYYGDGSMRQTAPISPAIHMGAGRVLVIGVTKPPTMDIRSGFETKYPSLATIGGHILNSIFIDSLEADLERLNRINKTLDLIPSQNIEENEVSLRPVEAFVIEPSRDLQLISDKYIKSLPWTLRFLLRGVGAMDKNGSSLVSYLMFEKPYCRELIALGHHDAMQRKQELLEFFGLEGED
jgi:NTE family protein